MKKLLCLLGSLSLVATSSATVVACGEPNVSANIQKILNAIKPILNTRYSEAIAEDVLINRALDAAKAAHTSVVEDEKDPSIEVGTIYINITTLSTSDKMIEFKVTIKECLWVLGEGNYMWSEYTTHITTLFGEELREFEVKLENNGGLTSPINEMEITAFEPERIYISSKDNQELPTNLEVITSNEQKLVARWEKSNNTSLYIISGLVASNAEYLQINAPGFEAAKIKVQIDGPQDPYIDLNEQDLKKLYNEIHQKWDYSFIQWEIDVKALFDRNKVDYTIDSDGSLIPGDTQEAKELYEWFSQNSESVYLAYQYYIDLCEITYRYYLLTQKNIEENGWPIKEYKDLKYYIEDYLTGLTTYPKGLDEYKNNVLDRTKNLG
ncbi:lipoprotein [Spiroplasma culicicola]|uniref:Lipoprotein n=1 Tax=Spiroplasma culicicola AES-1 TaxID=1276246 RepID=W6A7I3_9MOLU|nr:lipoprotein [Spiroplasma culicicola]AHI52941.1 hypothetical protein SCULI_v1c06000 [Spiroplasma culicicola AES-1]